MSKVYQESIFFIYNLSISILSEVIIPKYRFSNLYLNFFFPKFNTWHLQMKALLNLVKYLIKFSLKFKKEI